MSTGSNGGALPEGFALMTALYVNTCGTTSTFRILPDGHMPVALAPPSGQAQALLAGTGGNIVGVVVCVAILRYISRMHTECVVPLLGLPPAVMEAA